MLDNFSLKEINKVIYILPNPFGLWGYYHLWKKDSVIANLNVSFNPIDSICTLGEDHIKTYPYTKHQISKWAGGWVAYCLQLEVRTLKWVLSLIGLYKSALRFWHEIIPNIVIAYAEKNRFGEALNVEIKIW